MTDAPAVGADAPTFDINAVIGSIAEPHRVTMERKGWLKDGKPVEGFKLDTVLDSYTNLEKLTGKKTLEEPNPADPEAFAAWPGHKLLGVPEKEDGYKFDKPALPDGLKWAEGDKPGENEIAWDSKAEQQLRVAMLKGKVGATQAQAMMTELAQARIGEIVASRTARANEATIIKGNLEKDFGAGLKGSLLAADMAFKHIAGLAKIDPAKMIDGLASSMGNEEAMRFGIQLSKMLGEDTLKGGKVEGFATSPDAAKAQIEAFKADTKKTAALLNKDDPAHPSAKAEWQRLNKLARPDG